ncbi:MAG: nucleotidyltransferase family protein [Chloroflexi bacterium]|nr:nucleotidyltransferase family protein [Chloroflexota bacterium]
MDAVILAGGRGERLMPLTSDRAKCMVEVAGRPLIAHQLTWLARNGVDRVVVSCGYQWQSIRQFVGDGREFGVAVTYAVEDTPLGRGGGLRNALSELRPLRREVLAVNGDVLTRLSLSAIVRAHRRAGSAATLLLVPLVSPHDVADVDDADCIRGFREKPPLPYWLSGGVYVLGPEVYRRLPRKGDHEASTWPGLARAGRLHGYRYRGWWQPVDSAKDVSEANRRLAARTKS